MRHSSARFFIAPALLAAALCAPVFAMQPAAPLPAPADKPLTPIVIDPGHGGDDGGAVVHGLMEKDIALAFAKKLKTRLLKNADLPVVLTRDDDRYVTLDGRLVDSVDMS